MWKEKLTYFENAKRWKSQKFSNESIVHEHWDCENVVYMNAHRLMKIEPLFFIFRTLIKAKASPINALNGNEIMLPTYIQNLDR